MEEYAYLTSIVASGFYLVASVRLLGLHGRTGERPELLLALYFALSGVFYLGFNIPSLLRFEAWPPAVGLAIEWIYNLGVFPYLFFIRSVFRPDDAWAGWLVGAAATCLLVGGVMLTAGGHVDYSLHNPWFLIQWVGYTTPCAWICCEAALDRRSARKRARLGLVQPLVVNRYLLLSLFGGSQFLACLADLSFAQDLSTTQGVSVVSNLLLGGTEAASVVLLWLAFFPPAFYANWIARRAATPSTPAEA
jgi:hypothetical protein